MKKNLDVLLDTSKMSSCKDDESDKIFMRRGLYVGWNNIVRKEVERRGITIHS